MYEVTRTYKVYSIDELPEKMKDKARALFRDDLVNQALSDAQDDIYDRDCFVRGTRGAPAGA